MLSHNHPQRCMGNRPRISVAAARLAALLAACLVLAGALGLPARAEEAASEHIQLSCTFGDAGLRQDLTWKFDYSDRMFSQSATSYHHDIARVSLGLALSAFRENFHMDPDFIADLNVFDYLYQAGFSDIESMDYDQTPSLQTVASIIGSKKMKDEEGDFTLIAVGICGGGYSMEWLSNFTVGQGLRHEGFNRAAQNVEGRILLYMTTRRITGRMKLWVTGYSRAAAIANIVGADMTDYGPFGAENAFVYTFATPRTTRETDIPAYKNIYNVVGKMDPVPMVPMQDWGFKRYGTDMRTPARETDSDYLIRFERAGRAFRQLAGMQMWNNPEVNHRLRTLLAYLLKLCPDPEAYVEYLQDTAKNMWTNRTLPGLVGNLISLLSNEKMINDENREEVDALVNFVSNLGMDAFLQTGSIQLNWNRRSSLVANMAHEHLPSVYLSWMYSSDDPREIFTDVTQYERYIITGKVSLACLDENGRESPLGNSKDVATGTPADNAALYQPYTMVTDQYSVVIAPPAAPYQILETAQEDGIVTINVIWHDLNSLNAVSGIRLSLSQKAGTALALDADSLRELLDEGYSVKWTEATPEYERIGDDDLWVTNLENIDQKDIFSTSFIDRLENVNVLRLSRIGLLNLIIIAPIAILLIILLIPTGILIRRRRKKKHPERYQAKKDARAARKAAGRKTRAAQSSQEPPAGDPQGTSGDDPHKNV